MNVRFAHPKPARALLSLGRVATVRSYPYRRGQRVRLRLESVGLRLAGVVEEVYPYSRGILERLWRLSGFDSAEEWRENAIGLHGSESRLRYVVVVRLVSPRRRPD